MTKKIAANVLTEILTRWRDANPHPTTELEYTNPFTLLVAVVLSAQATDAGVNKATKALFKIAPTAEAMLALGEDGVTQHIKTIGLYKSKAKNIMGLCQRLIALHGGEVPNDQAALEALPGVGRKTANVVRNTLFGAHTIAVDTHVFRIANRIGIAPGKTPLEVEKGLLSRIPAPFKKDAHHWLILHGRYVCVARKPKCAQCLIRDLCPFDEKTA